MPELPWNIYNQSYDGMNDKKLANIVRYGGMFQGRGWLNQFLQGYMMLKQNQQKAGRLKKISPAGFYRQLFAQFEPQINEYLQRALSLAPYGLDTGAFKGKEASIMEAAALGSSSLAKILRAQMATGAQSLAKGMTDFKMQQAAGQSQQLMQQMWEQARMRPQLMAQLMLTLFNPSLLASLQAQQRAADIARSQSNAAFWGSVGSSFMRSAMGGLFGG